MTDETYTCDTCGEEFDHGGAKALHQFHCQEGTKTSFMREIIEIAGLDEDDYVEVEGKNSDLYIDGLKKSGARKVLEEIR